MVGVARGLAIGPGPGMANLLPRTVSCNELAYRARVCVGYHYYVSDVWANHALIFFFEDLNRSVL